jgi:hypothetical protein
VIPDYQNRCDKIAKEIKRNASNKGIKDKGKEHRAENPENYA